MSREEASEVFSPYFYIYHSRLYRERGYLGCILDFVRWWASLLEVKGKNILDIGCGFGIFTLLFTFFDAKQVYGVDHNQEKYDLFQKVLSMINPPIDNATVSLQDGHKLQFSDGQFPIIFIKDVISHVRSLHQFLGEVSRVLSSGGRIIITDENNALDLFGKKGRRKIWLAGEEGIYEAGDLRAIDPPKSFREMRREDIADYLAGKDLHSLPGIKNLVPDYTDKQENLEQVVNILSTLTQGLWGNELLEGTDQILQTGTLKIKPVFPYRNPRSGVFEEREFNPFWVARELRQHGIKAKVIRPFYSTKKPLLNMFGKVIRVAHPLSIFVQPNFHILGTKDAS